MRIALTGASSTGKTTLLGDLLDSVFFKDRKIDKSQIDIRRMAIDLGVNAGGTENQDLSLREFQWRVLEAKRKSEYGLKLYITDRSTVDMATYWLVRESPNEIDDEGVKYIDACRNYAAIFDLHIHLPFGAIPFMNDGERPSSVNFNRQTCLQVQKFLNEWKVPHITINETGREERVNEVISILKKER
tara:strand:- start:13911 stop:14474 length:564 start_codon:yes stop_codon:yes gene_type:complete